MERTVLVGLIAFPSREKFQVQFTWEILSLVLLYSRIPPLYDSFYPVRVSNYNRDKTAFRLFHFHGYCSSVKKKI